MNTIERAQAAYRLKENPDYQALMAEFEAELFAKFGIIPIGDTEQLANLHAISHGFRSFQKVIDKYISAAAFEAQKEESY